MGEALTFTEKLAERLSEVLLDAIDEHGGDPQEAVLAARGNSIQAWRAYQVGWIRAKGAAWGAVEGGVPIVGIFAIVPDMRRLFGHVAYACWGIGEILGCQVLGKADIIQIMRIWSDENSDHLMAVSKRFANAAGSLMDLSDGITSLADLTEQIQAEENDYEIDNLTYQLAVANRIFELQDATSDLESLRQELRQATVGAAGTVVTKKLLKGFAKIGAKGLAKGAAKAAPKIAAKASSKIAVKVATKVASHGTASWVPILGSVLGASAGLFINGWVANGMLDAAESYYGNPINVK